MTKPQPLDDAGTDSKPSRDQPGQAPARLVIVMGGIGSLDWCGIALRRILKVQRLPLDIQIVSWGLGFARWYADLTNVANRDTQAHKVAETIREYKERSPDSPVFLVAKSGGTGIAVKALEWLADDAVERAILLAPAISPRYDLAAALRAVRREIVVFWSPLDVVVLGAGTRLFGTIDRVKSVGAGLVGFQAPALDHVDHFSRGGPYGKLRQVRWHVRMAASGNFGGHMGPDSPLFLRRYVVPLLTVEESAHS